jgi:hypothetical protein
MARLVVEDCYSLNIQRDLFRERLLKFDALTEGTWNGLRWRVLLSETGSFIDISGHRWELVPHPSSSSARWYVRWYVSDHTGRRVSSLYLTPTGQLGSRWELGARYRSQRLWTKKRQRAWQRFKVLQRLEGPTDFKWVQDHSSYVARKPKRMERVTYDRLTRRLQSYSDNSLS